MTSLIKSWASSDIEKENYYDNEIPDYLRLDLRLSYKPFKGLELNLTGQNLLDDEHVEFGDTFLGNSSRIQRSIFGSITFRRN